MAIPIGTYIASYEITALLGKGGMGEVYRARDTKLKREVAIKILPDEFSTDPARVSRFQREAEVLASLNHPNIGAIYDLLEVGDTRFLVLELVEGETLAERLQRSPIPFEEAIAIAIRICEALEAAHEKGIVHRDLKPANVKVTPEGKVKVLDFGLAKALENIPANPNLSNSPTLSLAATNAGMILGTAAYMSPEQAKGLDADPRSDVFAFGCVLYETLTRRQAFQGESVSEILAAVLIRDVDFNALPTDLNARILDLLRRCLEKNSKKRWQAVGDLRAKLEIIAKQPRAVSSPMQVAAASPRSIWKQAIAVVAAALIFSALTGIAVWRLKPSTPAIVMRFAIGVPDDQAFTGISRQFIALSHDGTKLAYVANNQLFLRRMSEMEARPLTGPGNANSPFFSPDGQWVGFYSVTDGAFKKIAVTGGAAISICKVVAPFGVTWDGDQIVFAERGKGVLRVPANGGEPQSLVSIKDEEGEAYGPQLIDGGRAVLFTLATRSGSMDRWEQAQVVVQSLNSNQRMVVIRGGTDARYVRTGHIVYALGGSLLALPFDITKLQPRAGPVAVLDGLMRPAAGQTGAAQFTFSDNGTLAYIAGDDVFGASGTKLVLVDRTSRKAQPLPQPPGRYTFPKVSPDGKRAAVMVDDGREQFVSIFELSDKGGSLRRLTFGGKSSNPIWSPDGRYIFYESDRDGSSGVYRQLADGNGSFELLFKTEAGSVVFPESVDPSGTTLALTIRYGSSARISLLPLNGDRKPVSFGREGLSKDSNQTQPQFSPNGKWIAYSSTENGANSPHVFIQSYPNRATKYQITTGEGVYPMWAPDGEELFYYWNNELFSMEIRTDPIFPGKPVPTGISGIIQPQFAQRSFDITPDGKQLFVALPASAQTQTNQRPQGQINIVLNWLEELKQRVPTQ